MDTDTNTDSYTYLDRSILSLPGYIRDRIYLNATPPRIIEIEEWPPPSGLGVRCFLGELLYKRPSIHPSLAYFAPYWRDYVLGTRNDLQLQELSEPILQPSPAQSEPWKPSQTFPRLDPDWLAQRPELAWNLCRKSRLYSRAPAPHLLQATHDSRTRLMRLGYQLAFSTRTSKPTTWFHFGRDTLLLRDPTIYPHARHLAEERGRYFEETVLPLPYNLAQFMPLDLLSIRKLALPFDDELISIHPRALGLSLKIMGALRVIPHLEQLFIVNGFFGGEEQPWEWADCDEADHHLHEVQSISRCKDLGKFAMESNEYMSSEAKTHFSTWVDSQFNKRLYDVREIDWRRSGRVWDVPRVRVGYACERGGRDRLRHMQKQYWQSLDGAMFDPPRPGEKEELLFDTTSESEEPDTISSGRVSLDDERPAV